jgi:hypothetical protein
MFINQNNFENHFFNSSRIVDFLEPTIGAVSGLYYFGTAKSFLGGAVAGWAMQQYKLTPLFLGSALGYSIMKEKGAIIGSFLSLIPTKLLQQSEKFEKIIEGNFSLADAAKLTFDCIIPVASSIVGGSANGNAGAISGAIAGLTGPHTTFAVLSANILANSHLALATALGGFILNSHTNFEENVSFQLAKNIEGAIDYDEGSLK